MDNKRGFANTVDTINVGNSWFDRLHSIVCSDISSQQEFDGTVESLWKLRQKKLQKSDMSKNIEKDLLKNDKQHLKQLLEKMFLEPICNEDIDLFVDTYKKGNMTIDQFIQCRNEHLGMRFVSTVNWFRFV